MRLIIQCAFYIKGLEFSRTASKITASAVRSVAE